MLGDCKHGLNKDWCTLCRLVTESKERKAKLEAEKEAERIEREEFALAHPLMKSSKFKAALFTDTPCRTNCWHAEGDVCACSCGGKNHGIGHAPTE